jgi:hypothetical protein
MKWFQGIAWPDSQKFKGMGFLCLLLGALSIVGWVSADKLMTVQARQSMLEDTMEWENQVSQLHSRYLQANPDALDADLQQAEQRLIQNFTHLAQWAQNLQQKAQQWNLLMDYRILTSEHRSSPIQEVVLVPLEIQISSQGTRSAYRSCLLFIKALTRSGPKMDIRNVTVMGDGQKATHLQIGLSVWMKTIDSVEL